MQSRLHDSGARVTYTVLLGLIAHMAGRGAPLVSCLVVGRTFGSEAFAAYAFLAITALTCATLSLLGSAVVATRFFSVMDEHSSDEHRSRTVTAILLGTTASLVGAVLIYFIPTHVGATAVGIPPILLSLASLGIAVAMLINGSLTGLQSFGLIAALNIGSGLIIVGGAIVSAFVGQLGIGLWSLAIAQIIHLLAVPLIRRWLTRRQIQSPQLLLQPVALVRRHMVDVTSYAGPVFLTTLFASAGLWLPGRLLLERHDGTSDFAAFSFGLQLFSLVMLLPIVIDRVFQPRLFRHFWRSDRSKDTTNPTRRSATVSLVSAVIVASLVMAFSDQLLVLYGLQIRDAPQILTIFMATAILVAPLNVIGNAIIAKAAQRLWLALMIMWFLLLIILIHYLGELGAPGMALSLFLAYGFLLFISAVTGWRMRIFS
jgi:O-antigen/teichoic acid export membrane protein